MPCFLGVLPRAHSLGKGQVGEHGGHPWVLAGLRWAKECDVVWFSPWAETGLMVETAGGRGQCSVGRNFPALRAGQLGGWTPWKEDEDGRVECRLEPTLPVG